MIVSYEEVFSSTAVVPQWRYWDILGKAADAVFQAFVDKRQGLPGAGGGCRKAGMAHYLCTGGSAEASRGTPAWHLKPPNGFHTSARPCVHVPSSFAAIPAAWR